MMEFVLGGAVSCSELPWREREKTLTLKGQSSCYLKGSCDQTSANSVSPFPSALVLNDSFIIGCGSVFFVFHK